jgi:protein-tyrosine phosphatase
MADHINMKYSQVTDEIYLGTNFCCEMHTGETFIGKQGVQASISLESDLMITEPSKLKYFLWLPTIDHTAPSLQSLVLGVQMITFLVAQKTKVYVHCKNGHGRAPTLVAAYFISTGMNVKQAIKAVARKRPEIHIEPVQEARLEEFAQRLSW